VAQGWQPTFRSQYGRSVSTLTRSTISSPLNVVLRTGWGHHGDYLFGWEGDSLQRAMDVCTNVSGRPADCASELTLLTDEEMNNCRLPAMVDETVEGECKLHRLIHLILKMTSFCDRYRQTPWMQPAAVRT
jgi:hypothetical protein